MTVRPILAALIAALALAACGVKGDPVPPRPEPEKPAGQGTS
jgi:hypothetical protein